MARSALSVKAFVFIHLLINLLLGNFLFLLSFDFSLIWSFSLYMTICVCVNRTIDGDLRVVLDGSSFWADWHHYNYLVFKYIIQVYLRKNTIRIIMARMYNFFS